MIPFNYPQDELYIPSNLIGPAFGLRPRPVLSPAHRTARSWKTLSNYIPVIRIADRGEVIYTTRFSDLGLACHPTFLHRTFFSFFLVTELVFFFVGCSIIAQFLLSWLLCCKHTETSFFIDHPMVTSSSFSFPLLTSALFPGYLRWHVCIFTLYSRQKARKTRERIH